MHIQGGLHRQGKNQRVVHIAEVLGTVGSSGLMSLKAFRARIRQSIADENLQIALDGNAQRRTGWPLEALPSVPDYQERRAPRPCHQSGCDRPPGRISCTSSSPRSPRTASRFIAPQDAEEAIRIFLEIARDHNAHLVAKSKSMVSEEIDFNHALEAAGMRVVETDLGEYIVQLRGERPSHIITPAVHLRRGQVGQLFHEKLGIPYTEDIPTLTDTARRVLREVFLTADIGVSGVNFGVAETGTLLPRHQRGQRAHVHHPAAGPRGADGHRAPRPHPR